MAKVFACRSFSLGVGLLLGLGLANAASSSPVNPSSAEHSPASSEAPPSRRRLEEEEEEEDDDDDEEDDDDDHTTTTTSSGAPPSRPSTLPYCPSNYVECGMCRCVPESICQWCPAAPNISDPYQPPPNETYPIPSRPSTVPYCPGGYVDCGYCSCVPEPTCQWCSTEPYEPPPQENYPITPTWPSRVPYCPRTFVDCGNCPCVPASTCRWCTGGGRRLDEEGSIETSLSNGHAVGEPGRPLLV
ncbi:unnamed protein product [Polarella glacialis]|uniref:Uncharacterized protein n=1 Tax=Polarella glacialis TaxID=89957 RepID=A0A813IWQ1_POLGL|nr:unnamed protein product [Polarella glacialis]